MSDRLKRLLEPAHPRLMSAFRFLYCSAIAIEVFKDRQFLITKIQSQFCGQLEIFEFLGLSIPSAWLYEVLVNSLIATLVLVALGVTGRIGIFLCLLLFTYTIGMAIGCDRGIENTPTTFHHAIVVQNLFVLLLAPGVNSINLFSVWRTGWRANQKTPQWPVELLYFNLLFSYFAGGISKLKSGLDWLNGYSLQFYLLQRHLTLDIPIAEAIASSLWFCSLASVIVVILEVSSPLAFFSRRMRSFYFAAFFLMQIIWYFALEVLWMRYFGWAFLVFILDTILNWRLPDHQRATK